MEQDKNEIARIRWIRENLRDIAEDKNDLQENFTPLEICDMMLDKVDLNAAKSILVLYNIEIVFALRLREYKGEVTFFTSSLKKCEIAPKFLPQVKIEYIEKSKDPFQHLSMAFPDKFDIVIANPPYSGKDLKFLEKSIHLAKSEIVFVHPSTLYINKKHLVIGNNEQELLEKIRPFTKYVSMFNGNRIFGIAAKYPISIIHLDMKNNNADKFTFQDLMKNESYSIEEFSDISVFGYDPGFNKFREKISQHLKKGESINSISNFGDNYSKDLEYFVETGFMSGHEIRKEDARCFYKNDFFVVINKPRLIVGMGECNKDSIIWRFSTEGEANNFIKYISSNFARACLATTKFNQNLHRGELKSIPLIDFSKNYDENEFFELFNLDEEMIESISRNILPYYDARGTETED